MKSQKQRNRAPRPIKFSSGDRQLTGGHPKGGSMFGANAILAAAQVKIAPVTIIPSKPFDKTEASSNE